MSKTEQLLVDLEDKLKANNNDAFKRELLESLQGYSAQWKAKAQEGLGPKEFEAVDKINKAIGAAQEFVRNFKA